MPYRAPAERAVTPQHRGLYPGFDVLDQVEKWDDVTAGMVLGRLALPGSLAFFTPQEVAVISPLTDLLLNQDADPRVPIVPLIDARLALDETDGWHYEDLPPDPQAWRDTLHALNEDAQRHHDSGFAGLTPAQQASLVQAVQDAKQWHDWTAKHVWSLWTRYATTAFYSHPWAWNEMGFPGPAYPRGYLNPGVNARERWETSERPDLPPFRVRVQRALVHRKNLVGGTR